MLMTVLLENSDYKSNLLKCNVLLLAQLHHGHLSVSPFQDLHMAFNLPFILQKVNMQAEIEEWSSWDEDGPTSIKIEGGNGNVPPQPGEEVEPDYFKDMAPTIRKTQKIVLKKREPLNYLVPDGSAGFSSRLAATQDTSFIQPSSELGDMDTWHEDANAWEDESSDAAWEADLVLRQQKMAEREKRSMEQQRKKMEKEVQRMMKKDQKIAVKLS
uniref:Estrogen receptor binding site associated antigen 9 n=1 Tax=Oncorhynchus kisutch TaxID=8019 RepID=A0A8C7C9M4_ONCKI